MSMAGFIQGWPHCHLVIIVYKKFMKVTFLRALFNICAMNANKQFFPLMFGVTPSESNDSWEFSFTKLKETIGDIDDLAIISDRNEGIQNAVKKMYSNAHHGFSMHIWCIM